MRSNMRFLVPALAVLLAGAGSALAHFVYIVPSKAPAYERATVILSEDLIPDVAVPMDKTRLKVRSADGTDRALTARVVEDGLAIDTPGEGARIVHGTVDYGVIQRGESEPFMLYYHPKAVLGDPLTPAAKLGASAPLEIIAVARENGEPGFRLLVLSRGKPVPGVTVTVHEPGDGTEKSDTNEQGLTEAFTKPGRYGAWVRHIEPGAGEFEGKPFQATRHYATLVIDVAGE